MTRDAVLHDGLAELVGYPEEGFRDVLGRLAESPAGLPGEAAAALRRFRERCRDRTLEELQELYTQSFDLNPACSMEVGWHLFGENYARGEFLVEMRRILRENGLEETAELPDHLIHVLPALARMAPEAAERLAATRVAPAIEKILDGMKGRDCLYEDLVKAVHALVTGRDGAAAGEGSHG